LSALVCVAVLPVLLSANRRGAAAARAIALFLMTPVPYLLLLWEAGRPLLLAVPALGLALFFDEAGNPGGLCPSA
jgi:hypothetical protein